MKVLIAQVNSFTGNFEQNISTIKSVCSSYSADLIIFPELFLTGYPIEDLVLSSIFQKRCWEALQEVIQFSRSRETAIVLGSPILEGDKLFNSLLLIEKGKVLKTIHKTELPNYGVFDEKRTFSKGNNNNVVQWRGKKIGFLICEDGWNLELPIALAQQGAQILISINASPFDITKIQRRRDIALDIVKSTNLPLIYVNLYGAQDDIVFDGGSYVMSSAGSYLSPPVHWKEECVIWQEDSINSQEQKFDGEHDIYNALILGLRDYVNKNHFETVLVGVSGGIDSALVATLAVDALGPNRVKTVRLPSKYSSEHSLTDAQMLCDTLEVEQITLPIQDSVDSLLNSLEPAFVGLGEDVTEENIQARVRGVLLMALSNKFNALLLTTGNKSEYAVGYATLYGDMCGGFAPIKDIYKTAVFQLSKWRNANIPTLGVLHKTNVIPHNSIVKPPSAELKEDQLDSDTLPAYDVLDAILFELIENNASLEALSKRFDMKLVLKIYKLVQQAEYKRRQSAIGTKISTCSFGKERRYPITNTFKGF